MNIEAKSQLLAMDDVHFAEFLCQPVFIRTVTYHIVGKLVGVTKTDFVLKDAAWVADSGMFGAAVATGDFQEVEPFPDGKTVMVNRSAYVDMVIVPKLTRERKFR